LIQERDQTSVSVSMISSVSQASAAKIVSCVNRRL